MGVTCFVIFFGTVIISFIAVPLAALYKQKDESIIPKLIKKDRYLVTCDTNGFWDSNTFMNLDQGSVWSVNSDKFLDFHLMNLTITKKICFKMRNSSKYSKYCEKETKREYWWPKPIQLSGINTCPKNERCKIELPQVETYLPILLYKNLKKFPFSRYYKNLAEPDYPRRTPQHNLKHIIFEGSDRVLFWKPLYLRVQGKIQFFSSVNDIVPHHIVVYDHVLAIQLNSGELDGIFCTKEV